MLTGAAFEGLEEDVDNLFPGLIDEFSELEENDILAIFNALLPWVLPLEVPNLDNLLSLCYGWGITQQAAKEEAAALAMLSAEVPLQAAIVFSLDDLGGDFASNYAHGPAQSGGCCVGPELIEVMNTITLASAHFYPVATAIRTRAALLLGLDL